jgi:hypothetical protein
VDPRAHGAQGEIERRGDLLVGEPLQIPEHDHDATVLRQLGDGPVERGLELALLGRGRGIRVAVGQPIEGIVTRAPVAALAGRETVEAQPGRDRVQPRGQRGVPAKLPDGPVRAKEGFLRDLLGLGGAPQHAEGHAEDAMLVADDQFLEGARLPGSKPVEQPRRIAGRSLTHGRTDARPEPTPERLGGQRSPDDEPILAP